MPLYLYTCRTCELEMEELFPLGQAPEQGIRCPLCGNYFMRAIARFNVGVRSQLAIDRQAATDVHHGVNCQCCSPTPRQRSGG